MALALLRGLAKDEVRTGAWEENKVIMVIILMAIRIATRTSLMKMARTRFTTMMQI